MLEQKPKHLILSQNEANRCLAMEKKVVSSEPIEIPLTRGYKRKIELIGSDTKFTFVVDVQFGSRRNTRKGKCQLRVRNSVRLLRLDYNGPVHSNPDDSVVGGTHLHLYKERDSDRWAYEPPNNMFSDLYDNARTLQEFLTYCNVTNIPLIRLL